VGGSGGAARGPDRRLDVRAIGGGVLSGGLAAVAAIGIAGPAVGVSVHDPPGDAGGGQLDMKKVSAKQRKSGKIKAKIRFSEPTSEGDGTVCLRLWKSKTARTPYRTTCARYEGLTEPSLNDDRDPDVVKCPPLRKDDLGRRTICAGETTGKADVTYDATSLAFVFKRTALGKRRTKLYFSARSTGFLEHGAQPPNQACCRDDTKRGVLRLRKP
jgi:hypothetical protein